MITEAGRLKLSNAENAVLSVKSNMSKSSPNPFIWTLDTQASDEKTSELNAAADPVDAAVGSKSNVQTDTTVQDIEADDIELPPMTAQDIGRYAQQVDVGYPTTDGAALYKIAEIVPRHLRAAFEIALGEAFMPYFEEVLRREQDPSEKLIPDILALYLPMGIISAEKLYEGYKHACQMSHKIPFLTVLNARNEKAVSLLKEMVAGKYIRQNIFIDRLPKYPDQHGGR